MKKIKSNLFELPENKTIEIRDLRSSDHPEFEDFENVYFHIKEAIKQNGLKKHSTSIFDTVNSRKLPEKPISFFHHMYQLAGGAKGVIKFRLRHSTSSLSRYQKHNYETLDLLLNDILLKHQGKIYIGCNGYQRMELIESVNELCKGIEHPKVLEAGCGSGLNIYLLQSFNPQLEIHGFEYTNARIASAIVNLFYSHNLDNLFLADVCNLKIPDHSFDVVYSNHVLEQLGQKWAEEALKEMWRIARKGIVVSEPSIHGANAYEKWRMNTLGYCRDLYSVAKKLPNSKILKYKEDSFRTYPNTSYHLVVEKTS